MTPSKKYSKKAILKSILKNTFLKKQILKNKKWLKKIVNNHSIYIHFAILLLSIAILLFSTNILIIISIINLIILDAIAITILQEYHFMKMRRKKNKKPKKQKKEYKCIVFYNNQSDILIYMCTLLTFKILMAMIYKMHMNYCKL
jgi:hypothetical protein